MTTDLTHKTKKILADIDRAVSQQRTARAVERSLDMSVPGYECPREACECWRAAPRDEMVYNLRHPIRAAYHPNNIFYVASRLVPSMEATGLRDQREMYSYEAIEFGEQLDPQMNLPYSPPTDKTDSRE